MKNTFKFYAICWIIFFALFNVVCFVTPDTVCGVKVFGGAFWTGYIFITIAFIGHIACGYIAFRSENLQKLFYSMPLITITYTGLILTLVCGVLCMVIHDFPRWATIVICFAILAFTAVAVLKATAAAALVKEVDEHTAARTRFMTSLKTDTSNIMLRAKSDTVKAECKKLMEVVRYANPVSKSAVFYIENEITAKSAQLDVAVKSDNAESVTEIAEEMILLVKEREAKLKTGAR